MKMIDGRFVVYGNSITKTQSRQTVRWQNMLSKKFAYDPDEKYNLSLEDNPYLGEIFGLKDILRHDRGEEIKNENAVIISTIRMGFGHYRIAMAGASCAQRWGSHPYGWIS